MGRIVLLAFMVGSAAIQCLAELPSAGALLCCMGGALTLLAAAPGAARWAQGGRQLGGKPLTGHQPGGRRIFGKQRSGNEFLRTPVFSGRIARRVLIGVMVCAAFGSAGFSWAGYRAQGRLNEALSARNANAVTRLTVRVASLATGDPQGRTFEADVMPGQREGIPERLLVTWRAPFRGSAIVPDVAPGEVWRMALALSRPRGASNPFAADREGQMFARGIRATGVVRGKPVRLSDTPLATFGTAVARLRYRLRDAMRAHLANAIYGGVIVALALGDQSGIGSAQWRLFSRTGITHLVAISGLHIGLIAGLAGAAMNVLWRRLRWRGVLLGERVPAQIGAAVVALAAAWGYCLLAGWGVPAQRTFFTLLVMAAAVIFRLPLSGSRVLVLAAAFVTVIDPWAPVSKGFWLSFAAVAWLAQLGRASPRRWTSDDISGFSIRLSRALNGLKLQWSLTAALAPPLAYLVNTVSLGSPFANAIAIPVVGAVVTPAALLGAALAMIPGCGAVAGALLLSAHAIFAVVLVPVHWIAAASWASVNVAAAPAFLLMLAMAGVAWAVQPRGLPFARLGWLLMLPMLCWRPARPEPGNWSMTALDVGQGSAVVLETAHHVLMFDTGPRSMSGADAGEKVVWPFLRAKGYRTIDVLVVSHADLDHVGGMRSLLNVLPVAVSYSSFDLAAYLGRERIQLEATASAGAARAHAGGAAAPLLEPSLPRTALRCMRGVSWEQDGVRFEFLHPFDAAREPTARQRNASSCVLRVQGKHHSLLLTADIESAQERTLVATVQPADLVMAAHHGSRTSSTPAWVRAVSATHTFAQMGYRNRFGHPARAVQQRWLHGGSYFWRTDLDGAILAQSDANGLTLRAQRDLGRRYWHSAD